MHQFRLFGVIDMKYLRYALIALGLLASPVNAGTVYVDIAGNGGAATNSGGTDTSSPTASGTAATNVGTTVTLDVSTNLGAVVTTPGLTQSSINIAGATNANRTLFWITGITSGCTGTAVACVITVDTAPTGLTSNAWVVGGRYLWPSGSTASVIDGALGLSGGADVVTFNTTPATRTTTYIIARNSGTTTTGLITIQGKSGVRPVLQMTAGTGSAINLNTLNNWKISNLQLNCGTSTTDCIQNSNGAGIWIDNVYASAGGGSFLNAPGNGLRLTNSEITGFVGVALASTTSVGKITGNYIHNNTSDAVTGTSTTCSMTFIDNLIASNGGRGIALTGTPTTQAQACTFEGNTIVNNTGIGIEVGNANYVVNLRNNIIANTGAVNTVKWDAGSAELFGEHGYNVYWNGTGSGVSGLTPNGTEFTTNPLFVNSGAGNYAITNSSPAAGSGYPSANGGAFPGTGNSASVGYRDIGAFQRQVTAGGSGGHVIGGGL